MKKLLALLVMASLVSFSTGCNSSTSSGGGTGSTEKKEGTTKTETGTSKMEATTKATKAENKPEEKPIPDQKDLKIPDLSKDLKLDLPK
jgi:hypothetical protein